jgi:threonine/homoserine/homoserine lactone efflux protein
MDLAAAASLLGVMLVLAALPSASVALVVTRAATMGLANGISVPLGIVLGDLVFVALALMGMGFLAETLGPFFAVLKICGGAYILWLGINLILSHRDMELGSSNSVPLSLVASFFSGFVLTLGDAKAIIFYASLFPAFVDMSELSSGDIVGIIGATVVAVDGVKALYAFSAKRIVQRFQNRRAQRLARCTAGCAMVGAGSYLIAKA